jgi:hypothetical protein
MTSKAEKPESRKRKHEALEEEDPYSCIHWTDPGSAHEDDAETLPMELWFKVFQYYCITIPTLENHESTKILMQHPIIAEILDRFLPYLGGFTFSELQEGITTLGDGVEKLTFSCSANVQGCRDHRGNYRGWGEKIRIFFRYSSHGFFGGLPKRELFILDLDTAASILIAADAICIEPGYLTDAVVENLNLMLPYGCFVSRMPQSSSPWLESVGIYVPYPPNKRSHNGKRYKCIRQLCPLQAQILHYDTDFLYIPPWRPR